MKTFSRSHTWLVPLFFILYCFSENKGAFIVSQAVLPIVFCYAFALVLYYLQNYVYKNTSRTSLLTTLILLFCFFFSYHVYALKYVSSLLFFTKSRYIVLLVCGVFIGLYLSIKRLKQIPQNVHLFLSVTLGINILAGLFSLFKNEANQVTPAIGSSKPIRSKSGLPDVYLILADSYTSNNALVKYWNYPNSAFSKFLDSSGFYTLTNARSSYKLTIRTMASVWRMDYLPESLNDQPESYEKNHAIQEIFDQNTALEIFRSLGYQFQNITFYNIGGLPATPYLKARYNALEHFGDYVFNKTVGGYFLGQFFPYWFASKTDRIIHEKAIEETISLSRDSIADRPKLVFCHLMIPHEPFLIDRSGKIKPSFLPLNDHPDKYLEQLIYTNSLLKHLVKNLLSHPKKPIIILMGDHGYRQFSTEPMRTEVAYAALTTFYFPDKIYEHIPARISSPNILRVVLNKLGYAVPLLKDTSNFYYRTAE